MDLLRYLILALVATPALAEPMTVEQRVAVDVANCSIQKAQAALQVDQLRIEIESLKAEIEKLKKDQK